jgi:hypothetical protein
MNLPSFPTDNLYKFFCIGGLVLYVASAVYYLQTTSNAMEVTSKNLPAIYTKNADLVDTLRLSPEKADKLDDKPSSYFQIFTTDPDERRAVIKSLDDHIEDTQKTLAQMNFILTE